MKFKLCLKGTVMSSWFPWKLGLLLYITTSGCHFSGLWNVSATRSSLNGVAADIIRLRGLPKLERATKRKNLKAGTNWEKHVSEKGIHLLAQVEEFTWDKRKSVSLSESAEKETDYQWELSMWKTRRQWRFHAATTSIFSPPGKCLGS